MDKIRNNRMKEDFFVKKCRKILTKHHKSLKESLEKIPRKYKTGICFFTIFFIFILFAGNVLASNNSRQHPSQKVIASVEVKKGDTLWNIARNYYSEEFGNIKIYIEEIKRSNGLTGNTIYVGQRLIIPHYSSKSKLN